MIKLSKKPKIIILLFLITIGITCFCIWQNNNIVVTKFEYSNNEIPSEFEDFSIVHISDLHNKEFGKNQMNLIDKIKDISPDIIVITGDLIDRRKYNLDVAMTFVNKAVDIAPVYYVSGNHEAWSGKYDVIQKELINSGVIVLDNEEAELTKGNDSIKILGLADPDFLTSNYIDGTDTRVMKKQLQLWSSNKEFKILLSHRPELFDLYKENNMNMVFSGHAHGGQFRIPFIGGLIAPDQGLFPKYDSGEYDEDNTVMFVSRGLGNSVIPLRIFNRPEIIVVNLKNNI